MNMPTALAFGGDLHRGFIKPDVGGVKLLVKIARMPSETELNGLPGECFLS